jgi:predicted AAA+ superfamily ATPase
MDMKRHIYQYLIEWTLSPLRKPLILRGARQVGKTHVVRQLGEKFPQFIEANFERTKELNAIFSESLDPKSICEKLELIFDKKIIPGETLLFFDEIQACPEAITALRYFYEEMPALHVIAAGSLVDFAIEKVGVPVGRVSFCYMHPMSFMEFLLATGNEIFAAGILRHRSNEAWNEALHQKGLRLLGEYMLVGGMPEAVSSWSLYRDVKMCNEMHHAIIDGYRQDFDKYARKSQLKYTDILFNRIPAMICDQFKFSQVTTDYQKRELAPCLELLMKARVIQKIVYSAGNGVPLSAESNPDKFKLIFLDVALTQAMLGLDVKDWILHPEKALQHINKGKLSEAFVGQEFLAYSGFTIQPSLYYWHRTNSGSTAELDYLVAIQDKVIPIKVKSGKGSTLKSMHSFLSAKGNSEYGWRVSTLNYSVYENIKSYPLYAVGSAFNEIIADYIKL